MKTSFLRSRFQFFKQEYSLIGFLIILFGFFLYSCEKSFDTISPSNDRIRPRISGVTVDQGMLKFDDLISLQGYLDSIESYRAKFYDHNDDNLFLSDIDPGLNQMEAELGFLSLSSLYDSLEYLDDGFRGSARSTLDIFMGDPEMQLLLNREHEVWIADTIFKVFENYKYFKIVEANLNVLNSIRLNPDNPTIDSNTTIEYFNENVPPIELRSGCNAILEFVLPPETSGEEVQVLVKLRMIDDGGEIISCLAGPVIVDWGDGTQPTGNVNNFIVDHVYEVAPNQTATFVLEATFELEVSASCGDCPTGTYKATTSITIANDFCVNSPRETDILPEQFFTAGGHDWKVEGFGGLKPTFNFLSNPKVWGEVFLYRRKNNGEFVRKRPDIASEIRTFGSVFDFDDCSEGEQPFNNVEQKRDNRVCVFHRTNRRISVQDDLSEEPKFNFRIFITSDATPNFIELHEELFPD